MDAFNNCTTASRARVHVKISDQDAVNIVNLQTLGVTDALESLSMGQCYNTDSIGGQPDSIVQHLQNVTKKRVHVKISDQDAANIVDLQTLGVTDALESLSVDQCYDTDSIGGQPDSIVQNLQNATKKKTEYDKPTLMFVDDGIDSIEIKDMPKLYKKKRAIPGKENKQPCLEYKRQCRIKTPVKIKKSKSVLFLDRSNNQTSPVKFLSSPLIDSSSELHEDTISVSEDFHGTTNQIVENESNKPCQLSSEVDECCKSFFNFWDF